MRAFQTEPSAACKLSHDARLVLTHLYARYRDDGNVIPSYDEIAKSLPLTEQSVDEAATELSVCGYVELLRTSSKTNVWIQDAGKVEAVRARRNSKHCLRGVGSWLLDHIVATILAGLSLAVLLAWIGLG